MRPPIVQFAVLGRSRVVHPAHMGIHVVWLRPDGDSYGEALRQVWQHARDHSRHGVIVAEYDVAVPLEAWLELFAAAELEPGRVIAVPYLLYPASTKLVDGPVWSNRVSCDGVPTFVTAAEPPPLTPAYFSLGCTYLPARLLMELPDDLRQWQYPVLDTRLSLLAESLGVGVMSTVTPAIHLNY